VQRDAGTVRNIITTAEEIGVSNATILYVGISHDTVTGGITSDRIKESFNKIESFSINYDVTETTLILS
jgi:hypothetical protein